MLVKPFKLREGVRHSHDGQPVQAGDTVHLTQAQAHAFRDKFVPVDDSDFKEVKDVPAYEPKDDAKAKDKDEPKGATKEAPQGQPVAQPPVPLGEPKPEGPADLHALDPARQGQQSNEQREIIDSGNAPTPAVFADPKDKKDTKTAASETKTETKK